MSNLKKRRIFAFKPEKNHPLELFKFLRATINDMSLTCAVAFICLRVNTSSVQRFLKILIVFQLSQHCSVKGLNVILQSLLFIAVVMQCSIHHCIWSWCVWKIDEFMQLCGSSLFFFFLNQPLKYFLLGYVRQQITMGSTKNTKLLHKRGDFRLKKKNKTGLIENPWLFFFQQSFSIFRSHIARSKDVAFSQSSSKMADASVWPLRCPIVWVWRRVGRTHCRWTGLRAVKVSL